MTQQPIFLDPITRTLLATMACSLADLRGEISNVGYGPISDGVDHIRFTFRGETYLGALRGRNRDLCIGHGAEKDASIALRTMLDGDAQREST